MTEKNKKLMWQKIKKVLKSILRILFAVCLMVLLVVNFYWIVLYKSATAGDFGGVALTVLSILFLALSGIFGLTLFVINRSDKKTNV
jgi:O-antigen/teichoic acid export membrane protein